MDNYSFDTDHNAFHCVECNELIRVEIAESAPRPITCDKCETVFMVAKKPEGGLSVQVMTESEPDVISEDERNMEENNE